MEYALGMKRTNNHSLFEESHELLQARAVNVLDHVLPKRAYVQSS
jgi:hypothetical protein